LMFPTLKVEITLKI